jgi:hypothetical protein
MRRSPALVFAAALGILVLVIGAFVVVLVVLRPGEPVIAGCTVATYQMEPEQAQNATVIAGVAQRRGLPHHAVTVAIAVAMQESRLRNLDHGDRDSLGLFQQRPSQGWGTAAQVQDPVYAAGAFFDRLVKVKDWQTIPVTQAGQAVQHSGLPTAYAQWEPRATAMAKALTGETAAGMVCRYPKSDVAVPASGYSTTLKADAARDLGGSPLSDDLPADRGWLTVCWLEAHAADYQLQQVSYAGHAWTATKGTWITAAVVSNRVMIAYSVRKG